MTDGEEKFLLSWTRAWGSGPRTNANGTTGWVVMHARSGGLPVVTGRRVHICAHNPCRVDWPASKRGMYPAPMHVRRCDWIPPEAAAIAPAAAVAAASGVGVLDPAAPVVSASEAALLEPAVAADARDIAADCDIPSAPAVVAARALALGLVAPAPGLSADMPQGSAGARVRWRLQLALWCNG